MGATVEVFNNNQRVAKTSRAFDCHIVHDLMRMYTLSFSVTNKDPARRYIQAGSQFICDGQAYDLEGFKKQSGSNNTTSVTADHVGYRLNNYKLAAGYSFVGTVAAIAADILDKAVNTDGHKASAEFEVGTTPNLGTVSLALNNTDAVTARYAIMALKNIGAESDFDNFTINFAEKVGSGHSETFQFGVNMDNVSITYDATNGTTYEIGIADLQQIPGHVGDVFDVGDTVTIIDSTTGDSFTKRIISYDRCIDDPTKNKITLGVFVSDVSTQTASMQVAVDNSIQQGAQYSNVSIDHANGFMAVNAAGDLRVVENSTDCFAVQKKVSGTWTTIQQLTADGLGATKLFQPGFTGAAGDSYALIGDSTGEGRTKSFELHRLLYDVNGALKDEVIFSVWALGDIVTEVQGNLEKHIGGLQFTSDGPALSGGKAKFITGPIEAKMSFNEGNSGDQFIISESSDGIKLRHVNSSSGNYTNLNITPTVVSIVRNGTTLASW